MEKHTHTIQAEAGGRWHTATVKLADLARAWHGTADWDGWILVGDATARQTATTIPHAQKHQKIVGGEIFIPKA